jgi:hypothetical protein
MHGEEVDLLPAIVTVISGLGLQVGGKREIFFGGGDDEELLSSVVRCQADCADGPSRVSYRYIRPELDEVDLLA